MKVKPEETTNHPVTPDGSFYQRWSEKKQAARLPLAESNETLEEKDPPGDEDMPPLESLDEHADYSGFLSPKVSEPLRKLALRKLFHSATFNVCDGLDDYDEDFTCFEKLGDVITADLRHRLEQEMEREKEQQRHQAQGDGVEQHEKADETQDVDPGQRAEQATQHENSNDEATL